MASRRHPTVFVGRVHEDLCTELELRRFGPWRPFSTRGAALHEWHPPPPTRPTLRSAVNLTDRQGINRRLLGRIWSLYEQAADHLGGELDDTLEPEGISLTRTGCRLDTHRDHPGGILSMSLALTDPSDYDGGELTIHTDNGRVTERKPPRGMVAIWPSRLRHGVNRVTAGERRTYVSKAIRSSWTEVDRIRISTAGWAAGQQDRRTVSRRLKLQAEHNRAAAAAWQRGDDQARQHAIDTLWSTR